MKAKSIKGKATCGWKAVGTEKTVTKSEGNHVFTVDNIPVLDLTTKYGGLENVSPDNQGLLLEIAANLPLQLQRPKGDPVMRPGLVIDWSNRSFYCSGTVPQGSKVRFSLPPDFDVMEKVIKGVEELKATQAQLVHAEKMASLGELTAGIAHEIQNPINFVKNFSEVNAELIEELKDEIDKGEMEEIKAIANDIHDNEEKIIHHSKRADGIVKGMLQHSRTTTSKKEPTDINELADEYLRLAYHGKRAKDKSFNADFKLEHDEKLPKIGVIPQDIGRVLLNLFNNAFHAVDTKAKERVDGYKPRVTVSTKLLNGNIEVRVKDNGPGIPDNHLKKIFQPFFTTKPTGEGTGLGLSLAYEIITKGHGGELKVETKEGELITFLIKIPIR